MLRIVVFHFHWWIVFHCMKMYLSFLVLMDIWLLSSILPRHNAAVNVYGTHIATPGYISGEELSHRLCASSVWPNNTKLLPKWFPQFTVQLRVLFASRLLNNGVENLKFLLIQWGVQWYLMWFWFAFSWLVGWAPFNILLGNSGFSFCETTA